MPDFAESPGFYSLCLTAKTFGQRPSSLLHIEDPYTAYCVDEAGAYLMSREPPNYRKLAQKSRRKPINKDKNALMLLEQLGAKVNI